MRVITAMSASGNSLRSSSDTCSHRSSVCSFPFRLSLFGVLRVYAPRDLGLPGILSLPFPFWDFRVCAPRDLGLPGILSLQHSLKVFHVAVEHVGNLGVAFVPLLSVESLEAISDRCDQNHIQPCAVSDSIEARKD